VALVVQGAKIILCGSVSLLSSFAIPDRGLCVILLYTVALVIQDTQSELCGSISLLSSLAILCGSLRIVQWHT
jgi:hypothetical protein